ncbi:MAG: ribbon-helix-helix domain-containing protein [Dehalococcoidia bacterium]|nr:ribbon-helix-helix domain-containing protein [Dehalococcoidia bacterium]
MTERTSKHGPPYRVAPGPDVDLEKEDVRDSKGNRITEESVREIVEHIHATAPVGRPPMNERGGRASQIGVRLPDALRAAVEARAKREGRTVAAITRDALEQYLEDAPDR